MYTIIITVIAFAVVLGIRGWHETNDFILLFFLTIAHSLIGFAVGICIGLILPVKYETVKTTYNLECLQDNNSAKGEFFLGTGQIEGKMQYIFYYEQNGFYRLKQIDYEKVKIKYSEGKPKVEEIADKEIEGAFINYFAIDIESKIEYTIYIPKGTIKQNYVLNAQ